MTLRPGGKQAESDILASRLGRWAVQSVLAVAALAFACNLGALAVPLFNMQVFNRVLPTRDVGTIGALAAGLAICLLAWAALEALRSAALEVLAARFVARLSLPLIQGAALAPRPDIAASEGLADLETLRAFLSSRACMAPFDIAWAPVLLLALLAMHWGLGALALLCVLTLVLMNVLGEAMSRRAMQEANKATASALRGAVDGVNAAEAVLALGMLPVLAQRWRTGQRRAARLVHRALLRARAVSAATNALRMSMTGAMVALGLVLALNGLSSSGSMVAGNMILARLLLPFGSVAATRRQWVDALAAWQRLRAALARPAPRRYLDALPAPAPRIVVENLSYIPPGGDRPLLRGVSFAVEPGEAVAVIGPSSAGKSTLLRLVVGMAQPTAGGAYLDGSSTYLWQREDFARWVGYVPQRPTLLEESVADNIARMQTQDVRAVIGAAKRAGLHRVIASLPAGYATKVVGNLLSGGQRQRLALARALYGEPKVLVLDEPSAFLDQAGEGDFLSLLRELRRDGITVLLATHRPTLLKTVDKVLILRDGVVAQFGPAAEIEDGLRKRPVRLVAAKPDRVAAL
jgi:ATP-binding cassette subfamily C protein